MLAKVNQYKRIDSHDIDHKVLGWNEQGKIKAVKLAEFLRVHVVSDDDDVKVVREVGNVKAPVTDRQVHNEALAPGPPEEGPATLATEWQRQNDDDTNEADGYTGQSRDVDIKQLPIGQSIQWKIVPG